jgi:tetratricopeptide (TPR) repeat protein
MVVCTLLHSAGVEGGGVQNCSRDCSGHGTCIDSGTCLCEHGWFGGNCSRPLDGWAKMHRLEHNFYEHDAFKSRYVLAAHHLRHCEHIVEIGGYRTPISAFLRSHHASVTTIDPYITPLANDTLNGAPCKVRHLPMMFEDYTLSGQEDCFLYIGLDYYDEQNRPACAQLKDIVHGFQTVVVDYAARYPTGAACFQALELPSAFDRVASVLLEVQGNHWGDLSGSWLPTGLTTRAFYALRHRSAPPLASIAKTFSSASEYSGLGASAADAVGGAQLQQQQQQQALPHTPDETEQVLARAGGAVGSDTPDEAVPGWRLHGLVDATRGAGKEDRSGAVGGSAVAAEVEEVEDPWAAAIQHARQREWAQAGGYWSQHVRALAAQGVLPHVSQIFEFAMSLYNGHQVAAALPLLAKVVEMEPADPRGYNNLAMALESVGKSEEARKVLEEGLGADSFHFPLNFNYGKMLLDLNEPLHAIEHFERAAAGAPEHPDVHFYLGTALRHVGRHAKSREAYGVVERLNPQYVHRYIDSQD